MLLHAETRHELLLSAARTLRYWPRLGLRTRPSDSEKWPRVDGMELVGAFLSVESRVDGMDLAGHCLNNEPRADGMDLPLFPSMLSWKWMEWTYWSLSSVQCASQQTCSFGIAIVKHHVHLETIRATCPAHTWKDRRPNSSAPPTSLIRCRFVMPALRFSQAIST